jgi:release factor glutamine methyltransferase
VSASDGSEVLVARLRAAGCVFAEEEAALLLDAAPDPDRLEEMVRRRVDGEPLEHVVGWALFCGTRMVVAPGVFVPRHRSELMVDEAVRRLRLLPEARPLVVDLCCGSGALGAALAARHAVEVYAGDVDPVAVRCAGLNLAASGGVALAGDLFTALPDALRGRVRVLLANVPYVPTDEIALMPPEARDHEVRAALDGGPDGLDVLRRVAAEAPEWLAEGGTLLVEAGERQLDAVAATFDGHGLDPRVVRSDDGDAAVVAGTRRRSA